jgi:hypothetical protein
MELRMSVSPSELVAARRYLDSLDDTPENAEKRVELEAELEALEAEYEAQEEE